MATQTELKNTIDVEITNKTVAYSIGNDTVGEILKDIVDLTNALVFESTYERMSYLLTDSVASGQIAFDKQDGFLYYVNKTATAWIGVGGAGGSTKEIIPFKNQTKLTVDWNAARKEKFGNAGKFTLEVKDEDGKFRQRELSEIVVDNIDSPNFYYIDLGGINQEGRLLIY